MDVLELPRPVINFLRTMSKEMNRYSLCWDIYGGTESVTLTLTWKINYDQAENALLENSKEKHKQHIIKLMNSELMSYDDVSDSRVNNQQISKSEKTNTFFKKKKKINKRNSKIDNMFTSKPNQISNVQNDKQNIRLSNSCFFNSHEKHASKYNLQDNNKHEYQQNSPCSDDFYYNSSKNRVNKELNSEDNELEKFSYNEGNLEEKENDMLSTGDESNEDFLNQFRTELSFQAERNSKLNEELSPSYSNIELNKQKKFNIGKEHVPHIAFNQTNRKKKSLNLKKSRGKSLESHLNEQQMSNQKVQCNCQFEKEKCSNKILETATADSNCSLKSKSNYANSTCNEPKNSTLQDSQSPKNYSYSTIDDFKSDLNNCSHRKIHQFSDKREIEDFYSNQSEFDSIPIKILHECNQKRNASQQNRLNHIEYSLEKAEDNPWVRREDSFSNKDRSESELRKSLNACNSEKTKTIEKNTLNSQSNKESNRSKLLDKCDHYFSMENAVYTSIEKSNLNSQVPNTKLLTNSANIYSSLNSNKSFVNNNNTNHSKVTFDPNLEYI